MNAIRIYTVLVVAVLFGVANMSSAVEGTWTRKADMPTARLCPSTGVVDGKIYAIGGGRFITGPYLSTVEVYDPATDTWTRKADMPTARNGLAAAVVNGKIYVIGGDLSAGVSGATVEEYDPATDTWTRKADMPTRRTFLCASAVNGKIYAFGGIIAVQPPDPNWDTRLVEEYDPATDTWTKKTDIPTSRAGAGAAVVDGKIYVVGGVPGGLHSPPVSTVEVYDPATDTWTRKASMPTARSFLSLSAVGGKIYAVGGGVYGAAPFSTVEEYDPAADAWTTEPDMLTARLGLSTAVVNASIYAIGGARDWYPASGLATVEEYDPNPLVVDLNGDEIVNFKDFSMLAQYWHQDQSPFVNRRVDYEYLAVLAENWLADFRLVAHWKLDETEGTIANNSIGDKDGTLYGQPLWQPAAGKIDGALQLDGTNDYVRTTFALDSSVLSFSVFAWVKGGAPGQVIISQMNYIVGRTAQPGSTWLGTDSSDGKLITRLMDAPYGPLESETVITDGQWHHVGVVYDFDDFCRRLYVDGAEVAKDETVVAGLLSAGSLRFGADKDLSAGSFFSGLIDDVRFYNVALSAKEIEELER
ncbi:MAG: kelch repeat-containing protein [Anaerolineae bacterium]